MTCYELIKQYMVIGVVVGGVNLIGDLLLVPHLGIYGAALATSFAFFLGGLLSHWVVFRHLNLKGFKELLFPLPALFAIIFFTTIPHLWLHLVIVIGLVFYSLVLPRIIGLFRQEDLNLFNKAEMPYVIRGWFIRIYTWFGAASSSVIGE
jgi:O-antigen/teichoic acid export membrane protein